MQVVPLQPLPNQSMQVQLENQACQLRVYQTSFGLFMDVAVAGATIVNGVVCENLNRIVRSAYLGFAGDFVFKDTQGDSDPEYSGLGSRFVLVYLTADEIPA